MSTMSHYAFLLHATLFALVVCDCCSGDDALSEASEAKVGPSRAALVEPIPEPKQEYRLEYKFPPNLIAHYAVEHNSTIETRYEEIQQTTYTEWEERKHYHVVSVDADKNATVETVLDHVRMSARADGEKTLSFDSRNGKAECPPQFRNVFATIGQPRARITFAPNGQLLSTQPLYKMPGNPHPLRANLLAGAQLNFLVVFPDHPIAVGDEWHDDLTVSVSNGATKLTRPVVLRRRYTLMSVKDSRATITFKTGLLTPIHDPAIRGELIQRMPSGRVTFDLERGLIIARESQVDKVVVGPFGPKSSMHAVVQRKERLIPNAELARNTNDSTNE